mmetsp:Transcript_5836/g.18558  ORF Transcript_5836/g.18558 Transcript_5836/m.18558 type:complete len:96 (+) Transcript_5836:66-353(+)
MRQQTWARGERQSQGQSQGRQKRRMRLKSVVWTARTQEASGPCSLQQSKALSERVAADAAAGAVAVRPVAACILQAKGRERQLRLHPQRQRRHQQ